MGPNHECGTEMRQFFATLFTVVKRIAGLKGKLVKRIAL